MRVLRWLLVVPAGILGTIAATFVLHWVILSTFGRSDSMIHIDEASLGNWERLLMAFSGPIGFVLAAGMTAPRHQLPVAVISTVTILAGLPLLTWYVNSGGRIGSQYGILQWLLNLAAAVVGCVAVGIREREHRVKNLAQE